jgi:hypothetical protein
VIFFALSTDAKSFDCGAERAGSVFSQPCIQHEAARLVGRNEPWTAPIFPYCRSTLSHLTKVSLH